MRLTGRASKSNLFLGMQNNSPGVADCQARDAQKLDFHFNTALTALNIAKWEQYQQRDPWEPFVFSMLPTNAENSINI